MRTLSSSKSRQAKVFTPVVVVGASIVAASWVMRSEWQTKPIYACSFALVMGLFSLAYLWWSGYWRLADEVVELPDGLRVRRGRHDVVISFQGISRVGYRSLHTQSVCILELHTAGVLGSRIEFLPISDDESAGVLGGDLWEYLARMISKAQSGRAV